MFTLDYLFSYCYIQGVLYIFWIQVLCQIYDLQIFFSQSVFFFLTVLIKIFCREKILNADEVQFVDFFLIDHAFRVKSKNTLPSPRS